MTGTLSFDDFFDRCFLGLTNRWRFPWQKRLFLSMIDNAIPNAVNLPTGTGKTSIMEIWLIALGWQAQNRDPSAIMIPRRLVWVVNRRVVVDQATDEAENILKIIDNPAIIRDAPIRDAIISLREALVPLSFTASRGHSPIAISTLRGERADNREWKVDPSRPSIIIGTVDMIGSKLLFSGYGDGKWNRPHHAGLLGVDSLIVHDESHLTPAFQTLLDAVLAQNRQSYRPFSVINLSATQREAASSLSLQNDDLQDDVLSSRLNAKKIFSHEIAEDKQKQLKRIVERALSFENTGARVLVFLRHPRDVENVAQRLRKAANGPVEALTGTMRGYERDLMVKTSAVFARFHQEKRSTDKQPTCYLVSTSAGEVGINIDADHMVCDLTSLDSMIQRFGRLNRFGNSESTVSCICRQNDREDEALGSTLEYLKGLPPVENGFDISPWALSSHFPPRKAFSSVPPIAPLQPHLIDDWSLTTLSSGDWPVRPTVDLWLHGDQKDTPETEVIWREEVQWLERLSDDVMEDVLDVHPILAREVIRQPTSEAAKQLRTIAERMPETQSTIIRPDGTAWHGTIDQALAIQPSILNFATVILPAEACGLHDGFLDGGFDGNPAKDVADADGSRCRVILTRSDAGWTMRRLGSDDDSEHDVPEDYEGNVRSLTKMRIVADVPLDDDEGDQERRLIYLARAPTDLIGPLAYAYAIEEQSLDEHNLRVAAVAKELAERLGLPSLMPIYETAGKRHDLGKNSPIWQRAIGNNGTIVLAKTVHARFDNRINAGFRHEFGSLMQSDSLNTGSPDDDGRLISHLIAAHHGYGRPHFPNRSFDRSMPIQRNQEMGGNVMRDFAALTRKHGWWGLAYIESVLKASDMLVSVGLDKRDEP